jgi:hypothetical protein
MVLKDAALAELADTSNLSDELKGFVLPALVAFG